MGTSKNSKKNFFEKKIFFIQIFGKKPKFGPPRGVLGWLIKWSCRYVKYAVFNDIFNKNKIELKKLFWSARNRENGEKTWKMTCF